MRACRDALRHLHWLPVRRRVDFKISTLVYRLLAGTAPVYLADECTLATATGRCPLRSADNRACLVKRSRIQFGDRCSATAGANAVEQSAWTALTVGHHLRTIQTIVENVYLWLAGPRRPVYER